MILDLLLDADAVDVYGNRGFGNHDFVHDLTAYLRRENSCTDC
jgi:hypothetical protein